MIVTVMVTGAAGFIVPQLLLADDGAILAGHSIADSQWSLPAAKQ